jgi:copper chaperone NosL
MHTRSILSRSFAAVLVLCIGLAANASDDIDQHRFCMDCGMDRKAYGFSRMLLRFDDGTEVGVCSLHCAVLVMDAVPDRRIKELLVADRDSRTLIDAKQAFWVLGGNKRGVMTEHPSWAFSAKVSAKAFISEHGGRPATWPDVLDAAQKEIASRKP